MTRHPLALALALALASATALPRSAAADPTARPPARELTAVEIYAAYNLVDANLVYARPDGVELKLDVYRQQPAQQSAPPPQPPQPAQPSPQSAAPLPAPARPAPTLIYFHGGGYQRGSKERDSLRALPFLARGWTVVNVSYRQGAGAPAPAAALDCRCAVRWVIQNAAKYGVDPARIVVGGFSAGGHLALLTGMAAQDPAYDRHCPGPEIRVAGIMNWYGFTDIDALARAKHEIVTAWLGRAPAPGLAKQLSPSALVRPGLPPIISVQGDRDQLHPYAHTVALHRALTAANVPNRLHAVAGEGATPGVFSLAGLTAGYEAVFAFFRQHGL